jgi:hypothetical protein
VRSMTMGTSGMSGTIANARHGSLVSSWDLGLSGRTRALQNAAP